MFHLYITLAYIIPNIYVFFRIKDLFISKGYRWKYVIIYLLIFALYPIAERFSHREMNILMQILSTISNYLLPFYLYLFLGILFYDLLLLLNLGLRFVSSETRKSIAFRRNSLITIISLSIVIVIGGAINLNIIRVSKYTIEVPAKSSKANHIRVAFAADFHIQQNTRQRFVEQFVRKVNAIKPDIMLYGGDIIEGDRESESTKAIEFTLRKIHSKYGTFAVPGNHEFYGGQEQGSFFRKASITILCDTVIKIDSSFYLAGRYDQHFDTRKTVREILRSIPSDLPIILMDHRPTELQQASQTDVDVQFSGHTHDGQMFPINLITSAVYELSWGYKKIRNTHFFVTSGLRLWGPPVKTAGKSEIMLVDIQLY
jgi:predicted MPP superfamily phosphohydrolase